MPEMQKLNFPIGKTFEYISTEEMVADCLTKALQMGKFKFCISGMGVV